MKLDKREIAALKSAVEDYAKSRGGSVARITYHKQNQYARGFIACYCDDRNIGEICAYADGNVYAFDVPESRATPRRKLDHRIVPEIDFQKF